MQIKRSHRSGLRVASFSRPIARTGRVLRALMAAGAMVPATQALAQTWTGGTANIDSGTNWSGGVVPAFNGTVDAVFTSNTLTPTLTTNVDAYFKSVQFRTGAPFTVTGTGALIIRSASLGAATSLYFSNAAGGALTINSPIQVNTANTDSARVLSVQNLRGNRLNPLTINGTIDVAPGTTNTYSVRLGVAASGITRFAGAISNAPGAFDFQQSGNAWNGEVVFAGNKSLGSAAMTLAGSATIGNSSKLTLGETPSENQTWGTLTLNNLATTTVAFGGVITVNSFAANATSGARLVGTGSGTGTLILLSGTIPSNVSVGGTGVSENNLALVKQGGGTVTIQGSKTYTGPTTVSAGILNLSSGAVIASNVTNAAGGSIAGQGTTTGSLTFGSGTSTILFDATAPTGSLATASVAFAAGAVANISPSGTITTGTTYNILKLSNSTFGAGVPVNFVAASRGTLALASANTLLTFTPTTAASITWVGNLSGAWDTATTANWSNAGVADRFYAVDSVAFGNGASATAVAVSSIGVAPGAITFSGTSNYTFSGGAVASTGALTKSGSGIVVFSNGYSSSNPAGLSVTGGELRLLGATNSVTGDISVTSGKLVTTNGGLGNSSSVHTVTLSNSTLTYTGNTLAADNLSFASTGNSTIEVATAGSTIRAGGASSGSGSLTVLGPGIFTFSRNSSTTLNNTFAGTIFVTNQGTIDLRNPDSLGDTAAGTTIDTGATLSIYPFNQTTGVTFNPEPISFNTGAQIINHTWNSVALTNTLTGQLTTKGNLQVTSFQDTNGLPTLVFNNGITGPGGVTFGGTPTFTAPGTVTGATTGNYILAGGSFDYSGNTTIQSNATVIAQAPLRPVTGSLVVTGPGVASLAAGKTAANSGTYTVAGQFAGITVSTSGSITVPAVDRSVSNPAVIITNSLILASGGTFNLGNSDMIIRNGAASLSTIQGYVVSSALTASNSIPYTTLAVFVNNSGDNVNPYFTTYDGTSVAIGDVIVKYTYIGDTNLDGVLDGRDYKNVFEGFATGQSGWAWGDVDNSGGVISASDVSAFFGAYTYYQSNSQPNLGNGSGIADSVGAVPEPTAATLLLSIVPIATRRRRT
jgi:autotransporter-associated beta strand protein